MDKQTWALDGYLRAWWHDSRLEFNGTASNETESSGFSCTDELSFKTSERGRIWKPEFYWEGAKSVTLPSPAKGTGELLKVRPDGSVFWSRQMSLVMSCPFSYGKNLDSLPFDTQACTFQMGMYAETASEVRLRWKDESIALENWDRACLAEWHATGLEQRDAVNVYTSGTYTYAVATVRFTRSPDKWMSSYFTPSVIMVMLSYLGFYLDPAVTPARVALGMLCLLVVMTNFVGLYRILPPTVRQPWLVRFMLGSFMFNVVAMVEQITVSFGLQSAKWLAKERDAVKKSLPWKKALVLVKHLVISIFHLWDENGDGKLTRVEFRQGIQRLGFEASATECNDLFNRFDVDGDNRIDLNELSRMLDCLESELLTEEERAKLRKIPVNTSGRLHSPGGVRRSRHPGEMDAFNQSDRPSNPASPPPSPPGSPSVTASTAEVQVDVQYATTNKSDKSEVLRAAQQEVKDLFRAQAEEDGHGKSWQLHYFVIGPFLSRLSKMDHLFRVIFPPAYLIFLLVSLGEVNFGGDTAELLKGAPCYTAAV